MIVNVQADHLSRNPPATCAAIMQVDATRPYLDAAGKIGLTGGQYRAFRVAVEDGDCTYVVLPRRFDAMAGFNRRSGRVYSVPNAEMPAGEWRGWAVRIPRAIVYVAQVCGNLAVTHTPPGPLPPVVIVTPSPFTPGAIATPPPGLPAVGPPTGPVPVPPVVAVVAPPAAVPPAVPAALGHAFGLPLLAPLWPIAISLPGSTPRCSEGSNAFGVCQK